MASGSKSPSTALREVDGCAVCGSDREREFRVPTEGFGGISCCLICNEGLMFEDVNA